MKTIEVIKIRIRKRVIFAAVSSLIFSLMILLVFYTMFLIMPELLITIGLIAPAPLYIIWFLSFAVPAGVIIYRNPVFGDKFFSSLLSEKFSPRDIRTAIELDRRKGYPADSIHRDGSLSSFLSDEFSKKVSASLKADEKKIIRSVFPDNKMIAVVLSLIIIASVLSAFRINFLSDIIAALRTGLPAELISIYPVINFEKIEANVQPPAYLESEKMKSINLNLDNYIIGLEGSKVTISGRLGGIIKGELFFSTEKGLEYFPISVKEGRDFEVSFLAPTKGAFALEFSRTVNKVNITEKSRVYLVETYPDLLPEIKIFAPEKNFKIIYGNSFNISFAATDDYGLLEINLRHREAGSDAEFNTDLITRFPRESKKQYTSSYIWNPILKEGESYQELLYPPGTERVEYYIEVRDINIFSNKGVAKSEMMYVSFTNLISQFKTASDLIKDLIKNGKDLLTDINNKDKIQDYRDQLDTAVKKFNDDLRDVLPRSSLVNESQKINNTLSQKTGEATKEPLNNYISFLEKYLTLLDLLMKIEGFEQTNSAINKASQEFKNGQFDDSFKRLASIAESLGADIMKELDEIQELVDKGDMTQAKERMDKLIQKIKEKLSARFEKQKAMAMKMAQEAIEKLDEIIANAKERIKEQNANIVTTKNRQVKTGIKAQGEINDKLNSLAGSAEKLSSEHPLIISSIASYANSANNFGKNSLSDLQKNKIPDALRNEESVVRYLEALIKDSEQQQKQIQQMSKNNFQSLMPQDRMNWFVFIPKEAVYTVPVKYKDRIIDISKKRSRNTREKESFWKEVLE